MKKPILSMLLGAVLFSQVANAGLILRVVDGVNVVYDQEQDITWLLDANYAKTSGYDSNGLMTWDNSVAWVNSLELAGFTDWRLPGLTITDTNNSGTLNCHSSLTGGTDCGFNVITANSELAYMFHKHLGNVATYDKDGNRGQAGWDILNTTFLDGLTSLNVSFENLFRDGYWTGTESTVRPSSHAWYFDLSVGRQDMDGKSDTFYAWVVRDGDVLAGGNNNASDISEPANLVLLGLGLIALCRRKRKIKILV